MSSPSWSPHLANSWSSKHARAVAVRSSKATSCRFSAGCTRCKSSSAAAEERPVPSCGSTVSSCRRFTSGESSQKLASKAASSSIHFRPLPVHLAEPATRSAAPHTVLGLLDKTGAFGWRSHFTKMVSSTRRTRLPKHLSERAVPSSLQAAPPAHHPAPSRHPASADPHGVDVPHRRNGSWSPPELRSFSDGLSPTCIDAGAGSWIIGM